MNHPKPVLLLSALLLAVSSPLLGADSESATLKEALVVTEVLEWGETVTALRLEYTDEIDCAAVEHSNEHPGHFTYNLVNDRSIANIYVNNSGKKDDVGLHGKYVFINLTIKDGDVTKYRDQVTFNTTSRHRDQVSAFYGFQSDPVVTRSGKVVAPNRFITSGEMSLGVDDFTTFTYTNARTGKSLNYHLYIPEGFETANGAAGGLPLVVHYPSGDYRYTDSSGKYRGALFTHPDAVYWATEEAQAAHPAFVVTVGGPAVADWSENFDESEMQQNYLQIIRKIIADYKVDPARVYAISLAGGSNAMWKTILANPDVFAAQISTAYDPYHAFRSIKAGEASFAAMLDMMPGWFFTGLTDGSGAGILGPEDTRMKGERLRDIARIMNSRGYNIDIAYGEEGELMWNGLLRGEKAERIAESQLDRARQKNARHLVTLYIPGTIPQTMHWSWNATYSNAVVRDWLFRQVNDAPDLVTAR